MHELADALRQVVEHIDAGRTAAAHEALRALLGRVDVARDPSAVKYYVFGSALAARLSDRAAEEANLYLTDYDLPQIHLFNLLGRHVPFVYVTTQIANGLIADACQGVEAPALIDVGIGTGRQMEALLEELARRGQLPSRLTLIGIEPSGWALRQAGEVLDRVAARLGVALTFVPVEGVAERLSEEAWEAIEALAERPIVNASFALHHIGDVDGAGARDQVLARLRGLDPRLIVVAEPNSDHLEPDLRQRFENAWAHFGAVFRVLDLLPIEQRDRDALKVCFFGREIQDILGQREAHRSERHEPTGRWMQRLVDAGFELVEPSTPTASGPVIEVSRQRGFIGLGHEGITVVGVLCGRATPRRADRDTSRRAAAIPPAPAAPAPGLDVQAYLAVLAAIARADQIVHPKERGFIDEQARLLGVDPGPIWAQAQSLEEALAMVGPLELRTRQAILRDVVLLALIDGEYHEEERAQARALGARLGFGEDELARLEEMTHAYVPDELSATPAWFARAWALATKGRLG